MSFRLAEREARTPQSEVPKLLFLCHFDRSSKSEAEKSIPIKSLPLRGKVARHRAKRMTRRMSGFAFSFRRSVASRVVSLAQACRILGEAKSKSITSIISNEILCVPKGGHERFMTRTIELKNDLYAELFGSYDGNAREIERAFGVRLFTIGGGLQVSGEESKVDTVVKLIENVVAVLNEGLSVDKDKMLRYIELASEGRSEEILPLASDVKAVTSTGKRIRCLSAGQKDYADAIERHTLTFGIGPAGSGKTFLAVAAAVTAFRKSDVSRIILTRPALEAGERLGFLPGDLKDKVDPYLIPLYDALKELFGVEATARLVERGAIEVAPLAYMRGRTLTNAFVILDEAQNTTREQMKMFLTRLGNGCKMVVTGDITQIDLPDKSRSGLIEAVKVLDGVEDIAVCRLKSSDIVRHGLVRRIIKAYDEKREGEADKRTTPSRE